MIVSQLESRDVDPGELLTAVMSGWGGGYHTTSNTPEGRKAVPISATEILNRLKNIEALCNKEIIDFMTRTISNHVRDIKNPHKVDLSQFNTEIMNLLYEQYLNSGYTGTYEFFSKEIFQIFQIAGTTDLRDGTDPNKLVTLGVISQFIDEHNRSTSAHADLFKRLIPGSPVTVEPSFAISTNYQIPMIYQTNLGSPWTYIGRDGYLHTNTNISLPLDYTFGEPMVPIFEDRTNGCKYSNDITNAMYIKNKILIGSTTGFSLDKQNRGAILVETNDFSPHEHSIQIRDYAISPNETYTVSTVFMPHDAKYLAIRISGNIFSPTDTAYFNLDKSTAAVGSTDGRFRPEIVVLPCGAVRAGLTWRNTTSNYVNIEFIFYIDNSEGMTYKGNGRTLGSLSAVQIEKGDGMSPIIHTSGSPITRHGVGISIPLTDAFDMDSGTLVIEYRAPMPFDDDKINTLFSFRDSAVVAMQAEYREPTALMFSLFDTFGSMLWDYPLENSASRTRTVVFRYSDLEQIVSATGVAAKATTIIGTRNKQASVLDIGHNNNQYFLNGYVSKCYYYQNALSIDNVTFLVGA